LCHPSWLVRRSKRLCGSGRRGHYSRLGTWLKCQYLSAQGALGHAELSAAATRRGYDAARHIDDPALTGFAAMQHASSLTRIGAAHRAIAVRTETLAVLGETDPTAPDTRPAEAEAALCLGISALAARSARPGDVEYYFGRAAEIAEHIGERTTLRFHLSPAQVRAWRLSAAVESGDGPGAAERIDSPELFASLASVTRTGRAHLDFARAYAQAEVPVTPRQSGI